MWHWYLNYRNMFWWNKNHETHEKMHQNALRSRGIRLCCDVTDVNNTENSRQSVGNLARDTRCYAGNASQSNPGSGWRNNSGWSPLGLTWRLGWHVQCTGVRGRDGCSVQGWRKGLRAAYRGEVGRVACNLEFVSTNYFVLIYVFFLHYTLNLVNQE